MFLSPRLDEWLFSFWVASVSTGKERKDAPIYPASPDRANDLDEKKWRQGPGGAVVLLSNLGAATQYLPDSPFVRGCAPSSLGGWERTSGGVFLAKRIAI